MDTEEQKLHPVVGIVKRIVENNLHISTVLAPALVKQLFKNGDQLISQNSEALNGFIASICTVNRVYRTSAHFTGNETEVPIRGAELEVFNLLNSPIESFIDNSPRLNDPKILAAFAKSVTWDLKYPGVHNLRKSLWRKASELAVSYPQEALDIMIDIAVGLIGIDRLTDNNHVVNFDIEEGLRDNMLELLSRLPPLTPEKRKVVIECIIGLSPPPKMDRYIDQMIEMYPEDRETAMTWKKLSTADTSTSIHEFLLGLWDKMPHSTTEVSVFDIEILHCLFSDRNPVDQLIDASRRIPVALRKTLPIPMRLRYKTFA